MGLMVKAAIRLGKLLQGGRLRTGASATGLALG